MTKEIPLSQWDMTHTLAYLAGPMTGFAKFNHPAFHAAEKHLRGLGCHIVNPAKNGLPIGAPWETHMRRDIQMMMECDTIILLPGWEDSRGACIESDLARSLGMAVVIYGGEVEG